MNDLNKLNEEILDNVINLNLLKVKLNNNGFVENNTIPCKISYLLMINNAVQQSSMFTKEQKDNIINLYHNVIYNE